MTARPGNWSLIADGGSDPVAGDPDAVRKQASYYSDMAETISKEASRLKTLGEDGVLVGKYKKSLQQELGDLSDEVDKAHQRYEGVGTALKPYAIALDTAKAESWAALQDAERAHTAQTSANGMPNPQSTDGKPLTDAQKTDQKNRSTAVTDANNALTKAKNRLHDALTDLNKAGKKAADEINDKSNDHLKDHHHWWDVIVKILKVIVEILNYVVIVLAIVALFCTAGWLFVAIFLISAAILAIDATLAATGNGSWFDVAIDVVGLLSCGVGKAAVKGGEGAVKVAGKEGARVLRAEAGRGQGLVRRAFTYLSRRGAAKGEINTLKDAAEHGVSKLAGVKAGDRGLALAQSQLKALATRFPGNPVIAAQEARIAKLAGLSRKVFFGGNSLVLGNTLASPSNLPWLQDHKFYNRDFSNVKEFFVNENAGPKAFDFHWGDLHYSPSSVLEHAGPRAN